MVEAVQHRYHNRLQEYWENIRGGRQFPPENEINPDDLNDIWPSCFLVSLDDVARRIGYRYSYLGADLIRAYGDDLDNSDITETLVSTVSASMKDKFDEVIHTQKPVIDESEFVNLQHLNIRYRTCLLPLGTDSSTITHIIGCMRWKVY